MADQVITSQGPFVFTVEGTLNSAGEVVSDLTLAGMIAALPEYVDNAAAVAAGLAVGAVYFNTTIPAVTKVV